jgi:hypothetical protein
MEINLTTVISSGVVATIIGIFQLIGTRYVGKILDHIERTLHYNKKKL